MDLGSPGRKILGFLSGATGQSESNIKRFLATVGKQLAIAGAGFVNPALGAVVGGLLTAPRDIDEDYSPTDMDYHLREAGTRQSKFQEHST